MRTYGNVLDELIGQHEVRWAWVRGHAGNVHNERCDELATEAIAALKAREGRRSCSVPGEAELLP